MEKATTFFLDHLTKIHDAVEVKNWYKNYFDDLKVPNLKFRAIMQKILPDLNDLDMLEAVTYIHEISQNEMDKLSTQEIQESYQRSMDLVSIFTLNSAIYPIISDNVKNEELAERLVDLYNDISFHLNQPRDHESIEVTDARRRFYIDFYLPIKIKSIYEGKTIDLNIYEIDFMKMYLLQQGTKVLETKNWEPFKDNDLSDKTRIFNEIMSDLSTKSEDYKNVLELIF